MSVKLLTEHHLEFLSLKGACTGTSESTLVKMPHCWKSRVAAHFTTSSTSTFHSGYRLIGIWENSEDPDEVLHYAAFHQSL